MRITEDIWMVYRLKKSDDENSAFTDKPKMLASCFYKEKGITLEHEGRNLSSAICTGFRRGCKKTAAFSEGGCFVYFFSVRKAGSLYGEAPPERERSSAIL